MAQLSSISIRVENDLKQRFYSLCEDFGLSAAAAFNIFMKAVVRERKIPFEISSETEADRQNRYMASFDAMRKSLAETGAKELSLDEINALIKDVRDGESRRCFPLKNSV